MEGKGACECCEILNNSLLESPEQSITNKRKGSRQNKRPLGLNSDLLGVLKSKKEAYQLWKGGKIPTQDYKNLARACRDANRKVRAQLELKLARDVKNKKGSSVMPLVKQKHRKDIGREMSY